MSSKRFIAARQRFFRPCLEVLEDRHLMSASAISNLGNVQVQFNLESNGHLQETAGNTQKDLGIVQGLYQGKDARGDQVAFVWCQNNRLCEFNGQLFISEG